MAIVDDRLLHVHRHPRCDTEPSDSVERTLGRRGIGKKQSDIVTLKVDLLSSSRTNLSSDYSMVRPHGVSKKLYRNDEKEARDRVPLTNTSTYVKSTRDVSVDDHPGGRVPVRELDHSDEVGSKTSLLECVVDERMLNGIKRLLEVQVREDGIWVPVVRHVYSKDIFHYESSRYVTSLVRMDDRFEEGLDTSIEHRCVNLVIGIEERNGTNVLGVTDDVSVLGDEGDKSSIEVREIVLTKRREDRNQNGGETTSEGPVKFGSQPIWSGTLVSSKTLDGFNHLILFNGLF